MNTFTKHCLAIVILVAMFAAPAVANIGIKGYNYFIYHYNLYPSRDTGVINLLSSTFSYHDPILADSSLFSDGLSADDDPSVSKIPLVYPNPFQLKDDAYLGYSLSKAMDVEIRFYDMRGYEILRKTFNKNTNGGYANGDYNKIILNKNFFGKELPAAVYFFVMFGDGEYIAKGKFAIEPQ